MYQIHQQDILDWTKEYQGGKFHAILCDPPYHLTTPQRFGKPDSAPAKVGVYKRASAGMMGQLWDGGDIAFQPETWAALSQHLYPGAFIMAFASSRGWHRMAVAMEDSGLVLHPSLWNYWSYLSGFPKATRIKGYGSPEFSGHRYGLQALKPSIEPIIVAQVPYGQRPVDSIVATGAGALNVDGSRIPTAEGEDWNWDGIRYGASSMPQMGSHQTRPYVQDAILKGEPTKISKPNPQGRWPANFLLTCCCDPTRPDLAVHGESCTVRLFDEQAGERVVGGPGEPTPRYIGASLPLGGNRSEVGYGDSGPASRMFHCSDWAYEVAEQLANAEPVRYEPKVSSAEREAGLDGFEVMAPHAAYGEFKGTPEHATNMNGKMRNNHPTLKPISLTKYLATLLLPPAAYAPRRILVPFAGVSSEMIGCVLAGWESVTGIESNASYVEIARARLAWWSQWPGWGQTDVDAILAAAKGDDTGQMSLFSEAA